MGAFVSVPATALTLDQRTVLALAPAKWRKLPRRHAAVAAALERCGLVETRVEWKDSRVESGAGEHVTQWRRKGA